MPEAHLTPRPVGRRGEAARETLFQRIDAIVGSIHPVEARAEALAARAGAPFPAASLTGAYSAHTAQLARVAHAEHTAHSPSVPSEADPVFGRLLERWFALERDRVLGEHLHLDQVKAVANSYAAPQPEPELRVVR